MSSSSSLKSLLKTPSKIKSISQAKQLHAQLITTSKSTSFTTTSALLSIYSNLTSLQHSLILFNTLYPSPPPLAWKNIVRCYTSCGLPLQALLFFQQMRGFGICPDHNVFPSVLKACASIMERRLAQSVHACVIRFGMESDLYTGNALMNMYFKLEGKGIPNECKMFDESPHTVTDVNLMQGEFTGVGITQGSSGKGSASSSVGKVFETMPRRDIVSWNTVIAGCSRSGVYEEALRMVRQMGSKDMKPDCFTLSSVLPLFAEYIDVLRGKEIHGYAIRLGFDADLYIGSSLIDMYANCSRLEYSFRVFDLLPQLDNISWNSMIAGCVQNGFYNEGLALFRKMLAADVKPMSVTFSSITCWLQCT